MSPIFKNCIVSYLNLGGIFDTEALQNELADLESYTQQANFWSNRDSAESVMNKIGQINKKIQPWKELCAKVSDLQDYLHLAITEGEESLYAEIESAYRRLEADYKALHLLELFVDELDKNDSYLTIHSGAGGTESCDWVQMLLRMYSRWSDKKEFNVQTLDIQHAEGGVKSVTVQVQGMHAYGFLKGETGVHRLVRISPFDSSARRHTTFASVYASPVVDNSVDIRIQAEDIRIDTFRAGGAGGQHVNTTDSAVRITHYETGIVVQCQNERSQHKNKDTAMKILKSRLFDYLRKQKDEEAVAKSSPKSNISWGNQIRSYVFQPYTLVKDLRTQLESGNVQSVMDGNIDMFIDAFLHYQWNR